jgi:hypothetical protein
MQLLMDGELRTFTPIKTFRAAHDLPDTFRVAHFEPKDYTGLGRIDRAGAELNAVRQAVLSSLPASLSPQAWLAYVPTLRDLFAARLYEINPQVGLKDVEVEFAVAGFSDVCEAVAWAMLRAGATHTAVPPFEQIYADWLNSTVRVSQAVHVYLHNGAAWRVQIVNNAYGRIGLIVHTGESAHYVIDSALACPAEGYMLALLGEVAARMLSV